MSDTLQDILEFAEDQAARNIERVRGVDDGMVEDRKEWLAEVKEFVANFGDYLLLHKSHVDAQQVFDQATRSYLTRSKVCAQCSDVMTEREYYTYRFRNEVLESKLPKVINMLLNYLEAPKPEQTPPAQT